MYICKPASTDDFSVISSFPRNAEELYFMSPLLQFPQVTEGEIDAI